MQNIHIHSTTSSELYVRNPDSTQLGRRIIANSIELIHSLGFEAFTFKKLGEEIGSPESSIYRYFVSKHELLVYLVSRYWSWIDSKIVFATTDIIDPKERLQQAINVLTAPVKEDHSISYINEVLLNEIVITEAVKTYHIKDVDSKNRRGYFQQYKRVVQRVGNLVLDVNPEFAYPHMLITTVIEGVQQQRYFAEHLPSLTDCMQNDDAISSYYNQLVFRMVV